MESHYNGQVHQTEVDVEKQGTFDWLTFVLWMFSLVISLVPVYISALKYLSGGKGLDIDYWFQCITKEDVLWVFATLLLFALFNSYVSLRSRKRRCKKKLLNFLHIVAMVLFVFMEATWISLKYFVEAVAAWPIYLGIFFMVCSLLISTPLEIDFIRNEG